MQGGGEVQAGPSGTATLWCAWGTSAFYCFCPIVVCARRMRNELQPCALCQVAKVGPMDPGSCMRRYISVMRLTRP
eukprot:1511505-Prymnesium_polylepis.1